MYSKNPLKASSPEQGDRFRRYVAFGNLSKYCLFKNMTWDDLDLIFYNVKFCKSGSSIEK